jgi:hypothetical protein
MLLSLTIGEDIPGAELAYPRSQIVQASKTVCFALRRDFCPGQQVQKLLPVSDDERNGQFEQKASADPAVINE